jgi:hypothetical protein
MYKSFYILVRTGSNLYLNRICKCIEHRYSFLRNEKQFRWANDNTLYFRFCLTSISFCPLHVLCLVTCTSQLSKNIPPRKNTVKIKYNNTIFKSFLTFLENEAVLQTCRILGSNQISFERNEKTNSAMNCDRTLNIIIFPIVFFWQSFFL